MVECDLAKVEVAGSNPVSRSIITPGAPIPRTRTLRYVGPDAHSAPRAPSLGAPSPSGKAEVCKTSTPGSNPGGASTLS